MNAFTSLLLAFPFYLAVNGKLAGYIGLAKTSTQKPVYKGGTVSKADYSALETAAKQGNRDAQSALTAIDQAGKQPALGK